MEVSQGYLFKYYNFNLNLFLDHLKKIRAKPSKKNIHRVRVDIKKLRFFYYLLERLFPSEFKAQNLYKPFKSFFKAAGDLRTGQIIRSNLSERHSVAIADYLKYLKNQEKGFKKELTKRAEVFNQHKLDKSTKKIKQLSLKTSVSEIKEAGFLYASAQLKRIKQLLTTAEHPVVAHKIRKHLKAFHSILSLLNTMKKDNELDKPIDLAAHYGERLGEWHDQSVLVLSVEKYVNRSENMSPVNLLQLIKLTDGIKRKNKLFLKTIRKEIIPLLSSDFSKGQS